MKRIISVLLTITMLLGVTASMPISVSAVTTNLKYSDVYNDNSVSGPYYDETGTEIYYDESSGDLFYFEYGIRTLYYPQNGNKVYYDIYSDSPNIEYFVEEAIYVDTDLNLWKCEGITWNYGERYNQAYEIVDYSDYYITYITSPFEIPSQIGSLPVIQIGDDVFNGKFYSEYNYGYGFNITIPNSIKIIGERAFLNCNMISNITFHEKIEFIYSYAFSGCTGLTSIEIPSGLYNYVVLDEGVFSDCCNLISVNIDKADSISDYAFKNCHNLSNITFNKSGSIGNYAFQNCYNLTSIAISQAYHIGDYAFQSCDNLRNITLNEGITTIGDYAFQYSGLTSITIPNTVTTISNAVFKDCSSLTSVTLPNSITKIPDSAFEKCISLIRINIPNSVTIIGGYAFNGCSSLTSITLPEKIKTINKYAFGDCMNLASIEVSANNSYFSSIDGVLFDKKQSKLLFFPVGKSFDNYTIPDTVITIGEYSFCDCRDLTSITIPNSVTTVDNYAFSSCSKLKNVYYTGDESEWDSILIKTGNNHLLNATIHYKKQIAGDIDGDGETTLDDVIYSLKSIVSDKELTAEELASVDLNGDGKLSVVDVLMIQRSILEISESA